MHAIEAPQNVRGKFKPAEVHLIAAMHGDSASGLLHLHPPDHVKIDVDGHELRVIQELTGLLRGIHTIWIEMVDPADESSENDRIRALLSKHGFAERELASVQQLRNRLFVNRAMEANRTQAGRSSMSPLLSCNSRGHDLALLNA